MSAESLFSDIMSEWFKTAPGMIEWTRENNMETRSWMFRVYPNRRPVSKDGEPFPVIPTIMVYDEPLKVELKGFISSIGVTTLAAGDPELFAKLTTWIVEIGALSDHNAWRRSFKKWVKGAAQASEA